ncbi:hypothetical protein F5Y08DRAFT_335972 [Xylaria arbuscula]|nr:hypothetical protein F5Y08DRAFT_335972 [Xylaria arbuscula]
MNTEEVTAFSKTFDLYFNQHLSKIPVHEWVESIRVYEFFKESMTIAATNTTVGLRLLENSPNFVKSFWEYEKVVVSLAFGLPTWLNRSAVRVRNRARAKCWKWVETGDRQFDWQKVGPENPSEWQPVFGLRISRELIR